jgi:hypothetical protein
MIPMRSCTRILLLSISLALIAAPALLAVITALLPLQDVVRGSQYIVYAKVEKLYPDKPAMVLTVTEDLKGKIPFRKLPVQLKGDSEAEKLKHVPQLLKRLADDLPIMVFVEEKPKKLTALAYTNGTWMQFVGDKTEADAAVWSLTHGEPYLRRTYKGSTSDLRQTIIDVLAGKKRAPAIDNQEAPGFGPEISAK